jgi:hypothetical protein
MYRVKEAGRDGVHVAVADPVAATMGAALDDDEEGEFR